MRSYHKCANFKNIDNYNFVPVSSTMKLVVIFVLLSMSISIFSRNEVKLRLYSKEENQGYEQGDSHCFFYEQLSAAD